MKTVQQKIMDVKPPTGWTRRMRIAYYRRYVSRFFKNLESRNKLSGEIIVISDGNGAPELSIVVTERL